MSEPQHECREVDCQLDIQFWYRRVYALCQSRLNCPSDAEDAAQETFLRAISRLHDLRSREAIGGWLRQIAQHVCIDMIRRKSVRLTVPIAIDEVLSPGNDGQIDNDSRVHILRLIHALPENLRETILLHYYERMTYDQMAIWLNVARSTVNERLTKARQILKQQLKSETRR